MYQQCLRPNYFDAKAIWKTIVYVVRTCEQNMLV